MGFVQSQSNRFASSFTFGALAALALIATACGISPDGDARRGHDYHFDAETVGNGAVNPSAPNNPSSNSAVNSTLSTPVVHTLTRSVSGVGYASTSVTISARSVLRVRFTPVFQGAKPYAALRVAIAVGSDTRPTPLLRLVYAGFETSPVYDFSAAFANAGTEQSIVITVGEPNTDATCIAQGIYCPYARAAGNEPWAGTLSIDTDGT